jgi:hypothetical protein
VTTTASNRGVSRAEFERVRAHCEQLRDEIEALRQRVQEQAREIRTQFIRMAEMQAILDEERIAAGKPHVPRPLFPALTDHQQ